MKNRAFRFVATLSLILVVVASSSIGLAESYDTTKYNWSFKPERDNKPVGTEPHFEQMLTKHGGFYIADTTKKEIYLTFDNGYENGYTAVILDVLRQKKVPAAFFITGHYLKTEESLVKRMVKEGHIVGNHSWHHPSLPALSEEKLREELDSVKKQFTDLTGVKEMTYLRPPRGEFSERSLGLSAKLGYTNVFWSMAYKDWEVDKQKGAKYAYDQMMKRIHPGAVMLLHSVSKDNAEALGKVIDDLREEGYEFKSLDDYLFTKETKPFRP